MRTRFRSVRIATFFFVSPWPRRAGVQEMGEEEGKREEEGQNGPLLQWDGESRRKEMTLALFDFQNLNDAETR